MASNAGGNNAPSHSAAVFACSQQARSVKEQLEKNGWLEKKKKRAAVDSTDAAEGVCFLLSPAADTDAVAGWTGVLRVQDVLVHEKTKQQSPQQQQQQQQSVQPFHHQPPGDSFFGCPAVETVDASQLGRVFAEGTPKIITGLAMGRCLDTWSVKCLAEVAEEAGRRVAAQVCVEQRVDLAGHRTKNTKGNFTFEDMPLAELLQRCDGEGRGGHAPLKHPDETYYLRSVPEGRMKTPSHVPDLFPELGDDFDVAGVKATAEEATGGQLEYHSSALRITSPRTELWTHYDVLPNLLCQVLGDKLVTLFAPVAEPDLYVEGTSSRVDSLTAPDPAAFPRFPATERFKLTTRLPPGAALYIPPLWFHHTLSGPACSVAVNLFFSERVLKEKSLYHPKDLYGNKDLPAGVKAVEAAARVADALRHLPQPYRASYGLRAAELVMQRCGGVEVPPYRGGKRIAVVTGGTGGIGCEVVSGLVRQGFHVVAAGRRVEAPVSAGAVLRPVDLSSRHSVAAFVQNLRREFPQGVSLLVNAAAVAPSQRVVTADGLELQFAVNVASYHRLASGLHQFSPQLSVINVASEWAAGLDVSDLFYSSRRYSCPAAYAASKQAVRILTRASSARGTSPPTVCCHPGAVAGTSLAHSLGLPPSAATHTASQAAELPLWLAQTSGNWDGVGTFYTHPPGSSPSEDTQWQHLEEPLMQVLDSLL